MARGAVLGPGKEETTGLGAQRAQAQQPLCPPRTVSAEPPGWAPWAWLKSTLSLRICPSVEAPSASPPQCGDRGPGQAHPAMQKAGSPGWGGAQSPVPALVPPAPGPRGLSWRCQALLHQLQVSQGQDPRGTQRLLNQAPSPSPPALSGPGDRCLSLSLQGRLKGPWPPPGWGGQL